jgi:hypothetical protein
MLICKLVCSRIGHDSVKVRNRNLRHTASDMSRPIGKQQRARVSTTFGNAACLILRQEQITDDIHQRHYSANSK